MKKVIIIGGGTGQSVMLRAIKNIHDIELKTIVSMVDDGGSTGRLRDIFDIPAVGDIRNVMIALSEDESLLARLMNYRFNQEAEELSGHILGNLILTALIENSNSFLDAIYQMSRFLKIKGEIIPSTSFKVVLSALMSDGTVVDGEHRIREAKKEIVKVFYKNKVYANPLAIQAINEADVIIYSIGSLYTSIMPNLIIPDIKEALSQSQAKRIYFCNVMSEDGETNNYSLEDHVTALHKHTGTNVDYVVYANDEIPPFILDRYLEENAEPIRIKEKKHDYQIIETSLLSYQLNLVRHDADKVKAILERILE